MFSPSEPSPIVPESVPGEHRETGAFFIPKWVPSHPKLCVGCTIATFGSQTQQGIRDHGSDAQN